MELGSREACRRGAAVPAVRKRESEFVAGVGFGIKGGGRWSLGG